MNDAQAALSAYSSGQRLAIIVSAILGFGLDMYNVLILTFVLGAIRASMHLSLGQAGLIATATLVGSVIGGAAFGLVGDRYGRKTALQWALAMFSIGAILSAFSNSFEMLFGLRFITGIGLGGEWGAGMVLFNEVWNARRRGIGSACVQGSAVLGTAVASVVGIWALKQYGPELGWRVALLTGGAPILLMIFVRFAMPESKLWQAHQHSLASAPAARRVRPEWLDLLLPTYRLRFLGGIAWIMSYMFTFYAILVFLPTLWIKDMAVPPAEVRSIVLIGTPISCGAYLVFGWLNDRQGRRIGAVIPGSIWVISLALMAFFSTQPYAGSLVAWPMFWSYLLFVIGNASLGVSGPWISELFPVGMRSTATSSIYMMGRAIGSLAPVVVPLVAAAAGGSLFLGMMIALPSAALFLLIGFMLPETAPRKTRDAAMTAETYGQTTVNAKNGA